jgi:glycosyltransferase involved in cell wall biosynthesis
MAKYLFIMAQEGHPWGGSEPLWSSAAEHLARRGNEVRVSAKDWGKPVPQVERLRLAGCQIFYRYDQYRLPSFVTRQIRRLFPPPEYKNAHVRSAGAGVDLVVVSLGDNWGLRDGLAWLEAARLSGYRYVVIAHSAVVYWWPEDNDADRVAACYERACASYFVSQAVLELSRRQFASPLRHGKVVRNPFNVRYDAQPPWPEALPHDGLALACVGRLDVISKGQDVLLQVLALPRWRERNVRLSLIGDGPNERCLRRMAEQLELTNIDFAGNRENIEEVWSKHHALVLPSRFEGMPLTLVEAMLCGRPCIVTDVGGNRELVRDGINGFLAKAPTIELLDEAMNRAWGSRGRLKEMGCTAAKDARQFVPRDPGEDFAKELAAVASNSGPKGLE